MVSTSSTSAGKPRTSWPARARAKLRGMVPKVQAVCPVALSPDEAATVSIAAASSRRSGALSRSRSLPRPSSAPSAPTMRKVGRRCAGTFVQSQATRGTAIPLRPRRNRSSASSSGSSPGTDAARNSRATFGAGTKLTRSCLGSDRISATTSSSRSPGTCQEKASGSTRLRAVTGTSTVSPSSAAPGSNW